MYVFKMVHTNERLQQLNRLSIFKFNLASNIIILDCCSLVDYYMYIFYVVSYIQQYLIELGRQNPAVLSSSLPAPTTKG